MNVREPCQSARLVRPDTGAPAPLLPRELDRGLDLDERRDQRGRRQRNELDDTDEPAVLARQQVPRPELPPDRKLDEPEIVAIAVMQAERAQLHARSVTARWLGVESAGAAMTEADDGSPGGRSPCSDPRPRLEGRRPRCAFGFPSPKAVVADAHARSATGRRCRYVGSGGAAGSVAGHVESPGHATSCVASPPSSLSTDSNSTMGCVPALAISE